MIINVSAIRTVAKRSVTFCLCLVLCLSLCHALGVNAYSPVIFEDSYLYDIPVSHVGEPVPAYSVADAVRGGFAPYTFSKESGPDWVKVSSNGTVSGTPTRLGENSDLVICVVDAEGYSEKIDVSVAVTAPAPENRTVISRVTAVSEDFINIPHIGTRFYYPDFTVTEGAPARFASGAAIWQRKSGSNWEVERLDSGATFKAGTYRLMIRVEMSGDGDATHVFSNNVSATVNGKSWTVTNVQISDASSSFFLFSPEVVILQNDVAPTFTFNYVTNGGTAISPVSGLKFMAPYPRPITPTRDGYTFIGWYEDSELTTEFNWTGGIESDVTIYAKWIANDHIITDMSFTVTPPIAGQKASYTITSDRPELYTATVDYWYLYDSTKAVMRKSDTFNGDIKYALRYTVVMADGYIIGDGGQITVNGLKAQRYGSAYQQEVILDVSDALLGDVTGDGKVNALDAAFVLRYDAGLIGADKLDLSVADVTGDGKVNALDAAFILRFDAGLIPEL